MKQKEELSQERKAEIFDALMDSAPSDFESEQWYGLLRGCGITNQEMILQGVGLPELKVTDAAMDAMVEHVLERVRSTEWKDGQRQIEIPLAELTAIAQVDLAESQLAEDVFMENLFSHLFLISPSYKEQRLTFDGSNTTKTIDLAAGTWAYNCTGFFDSGNITITGTIQESASSAA